MTDADLPERVIVDQHGHYWRDYGGHLSMPPVSDENNRTEVAAVYVRAVRTASADGSGPARYVESGSEREAGLDVERLARALNADWSPAWYERVSTVTPLDRPGSVTFVPAESGWNKRELARIIAAEYDRLARSAAPTGASLGRQIVDAALAAGPGFCGRIERHGPHQVDEWNACAGVPAPTGASRDAGLDACEERERNLRQALLEGSYFHVKHDGTPRHPETCSDCRRLAESRRPQMEPRP